MNSLKQTLMSYNPSEFVPVYREGSLDKRAFFGYKARKAMEHVGRVVVSKIEVVDTIFTRPL